MANYINIWATNVLLHTFLKVKTVQALKQAILCVRVRRAAKFGRVSVNEITAYRPK